MMFVTIAIAGPNGDQGTVHNGDENANPEPPETQEKPHNQTTEHSCNRTQPEPGPGPNM